MRYVLPALLFLANDEAVSLLGLFIIVCVFIYDLAKEAMKRA